jgi:quinohemoprotein ethanol dehydrogenase
VFAIDAHTGATKWTYRANLNQKIATICCGWTNRGVALGDGRVYFGQLDGKFVALDQETGKVDWTTPVGDYKQGTTITSAPLYYNGRVYSGLSGGGVRDPWPPHGHGRKDGQDPLALLHDPRTGPGRT